MHLHPYGILTRVVRGIARPHADNLADAPIPTADKRIRQRLGFLEGHHVSSIVARMHRAATASSLQARSYPRSSQAWVVSSAGHFPFCQCIACSLSHLISA